MTNEEFTTKYKDVEVAFNSYYKYDFTFKGIAPDGVEIVATFGGQDDIYRYDVTRDSKQKLGDVNEWMSVCAKFNGEKIYDFYDY